MLYVRAEMKGKRWSLGFGVLREGGLGVFRE